MFQFSYSTFKQHCIEWDQEKYMLGEMKHIDLSLLFSVIYETQLIVFWAQPSMLRTLRYVFVGIDKKSSAIKTAKDAKNRTY